MELSDLKEEGLANAVLSWMILFMIGASAVESALNGEPVWSGLMFFSLVLGLLPAFRMREWRTMLPFEMLMLVLLPFIPKVFEIGFIATHTLNYLSSSAIALMTVAELDEYTSLRTTPAFSVLLVSVATVAFAGLWAVVRWLSDIYRGTALIISEELLMWEFTAAAFAGILAGGIYVKYFNYRLSRTMRSEKT